MATFILPFEKMHGLGNDFVMLHGKHLPPNANLPELASQLCNRNFGIGADGIIIACAQPPQDADIEWIYLNSDGSTGEMCGNGMRCFAKYLFDRNLIRESSFTVKTLAGIISPEILPDGLIRVNMGSVIAEAVRIPVSIPAAVASYKSVEELSIRWKDSPEKIVLNQPIDIQGNIFLYTPISIGNPHAIIFLDSLKELSEVNLSTTGKQIELHEHFPAKTNVEFAWIEDRTHLHLRVWERGSGITLACGTGACATTVVGMFTGRLAVDKPVCVNLPGGQLMVEWNFTDNFVYLTGPAQSVFVGQVELHL